jgi:L,D-transpeptidase YcbB
MRSLKRMLAAALVAAMPSVGLAAPETAASPAARLMLPMAPQGLTAQLTNLERVVLIDASSAQLFMIEHGRTVDSMRVIVGGPGTPTPSFRSMLRHATLNPYWNVPPEIAASLIAPQVLQKGAAYLHRQGYEVVSEIGPQARVLAPESVDWKAVAAGTAQVQIRQLPRWYNSMGRMKFDIANAGGIFLHDTPNKKPFAEVKRNKSHGCVRLEDAPRFARWLFGRDLEAGSSAPEQHVPLPAPVPIIITYLDPQPESALTGAIAAKQPVPALLNAAAADSAGPGASAAATASLP